MRHAAVAHGLCLIGRGLVSRFNDRGAGANSLVKRGIVLAGAPFPVLRLRMGCGAEENLGSTTGANGKQPPMTIQISAHGCPTRPAGRNCTENGPPKQW